MFAMDTYITMTAYGLDAETALSKAEDKLTELEHLWSVTDPDSDIYAVNHADAQPVSVSEETASLLSFALLDLGGNIQAVGTKSDGSPWRLGLRDPFSDGTLGVLEISNQAVVTSGAYERYFIGEDGTRYGHIIDPATGYPAESGLASAQSLRRKDDFVMHCPLPCM